MVLKRKELADAVADRMKELGIKTQPAFVEWLEKKGCMVHQATLSRLLNQEIYEVSNRVKSVCKYAGIDIRMFVVRAVPQKSRLLMKALEQAWDGSKPRERWLARLIKAAGAAPPAN